MKMIPDQIINAICDMLVLSLELGAILAAIAGLIVLCTRRSSARFRYNLLVAVLGAFAFMLLITFVRQLSSIETGLNGHAIRPVISLAGAASPQPVGSSYFDNLIALVRAHANYIVMIWSLIVLAKAIQLLSGLQSLYFLRRRQTSPVSSEWEARVTQIAVAIGINRMVRIAESGIARMPMMIGHLKPLILIPAGMISGLPPSSIEAILVHELAHIRRSDYLVNLLISSLEAIFFFNPAVLWLAALIRAERENCCDDIAVAYTGSKKGYITALVACQEYQPAITAYAMPFSGRKGHLMDRVKRMLSNNNTSLNIFERTFLGLVLLTAVLFTTAFSNAGHISKLVVKVKQVTATNRLAPKQEVVQVQAKTSQPKKVAPVDDNTLRLDSAIFRIYRSAQVGESTDVTFNNGGLQTRLVKKNGTLYQVNEQEGQLVSMQVDGNSVPPGDRPRYMALIAPAAAPTPQAYARERQAYVENPYPKDTQPYHDGNNREKLTNDLIADGIIKKAADLSSFKLSDSEFIVNGKKLPDDVHLKFKEAYVPPSGFSKQGTWSWLYNYSENN